MEALLKNELARARIALIWKKRAVGEHQSTARFASYAGRLHGLGVPQHFVDKAYEGSEQEAAHKQVCIDMAHRLGFGEIGFAPQDFTPVGTAAPEEMMLTDMVAFCCLVETLNVAQLSSALQQIEEPEIRKATRTLLVDEVKHSRLGWAYLTWARRKGVGENLGSQIARLFWEAIPSDLFVDGPPHPEAAVLLTVGDPSIPDRRALFFKTTNEVILPGLEANGVSTVGVREWLEHPTWPEGEVGASYR